MRLGLIILHLSSRISGLQLIVHGKESVSRHYEICDQCWMKYIFRDACGGTIVGSVSSDLKLLLIEECYKRMIRNNDHIIGKEALPCLD